MAMLKDILQDLVNYSVTLNFDIIRVTGNEKETLFEAVREDKKIIMKAHPKEAISEFAGQFGMPNLRILKGYVETFSKLDVHEDDKPSLLSIEVQNNNKVDKTIPTDVEFKVPGAAIAIYRLKKDNLPPQPNMNAKSVKWEAEIVQPSKTKIQDFNAFASILADLEKCFSVKSDGTDLKFYIGDENSSNSKVNFTFASDIKGKVDPKLYWTCNDFLSIMSLASAAETVVKISNVGVIKIEVDTGLMNYEFLLPGSNR